MTRRPSSLTSCSGHCWCRWSDRVRALVRRAGAIGTVIGRAPRGDLPVAEIMRDCVQAEAPSGDRILLHVPSGTYLRLDASASTIFDLLVEYGDRSNAAANLADRYDIPVERAEIDVGSVITTISRLRASRASHGRRPGITGMRRTLREWWSLPARLRLDVVRTTAVVVVAEIGLRTTDIARLADLMRVPLATQMADIPTIAPLDRSRLTSGEERLQWATGWTLDRWVYDGTCLRRALVSGFFLRRHHPVLRLGLIGEGQNAHAWVEAEGMSFDASGVTDTFVAVDRDLRGRAD